RRENLLAALHAREDIVDVRAAVKSDGTLVGLDVRILTDFGAYAYFPANYMPRVVGMMIPGAYRLRDYRYAITAVLTNKCPAGPIVGIGVATYVEPNTYGSEFYRTAGIPGSGHDAAIVRIEPSGAVSAQIGVVGQGQGHLTTVAQALADALAVPIDKVRVHAGDPAAAPYGMGPRGS